MTMIIFWPVPGFYTPNSDQNFVPVSYFSTHYYQINLCLWEITNSGHTGKHAVVLAMLYDPNILLTALDLIVSIL